MMCIGCAGALEFAPAWCALVVCILPCGHRCFTTGINATRSLGINTLLPRVHCDEDSESLRGPSLLEQADAAAEEDRFRIKTPPQFENIKLSLNAGRVNSFDGLRFNVYKTVNLNTAVSHFYWIGSQQTPVPIYQYRIIFPYDKNVLNIASDADCNVEGEAKYTVNQSLAVKSTFVASSRENNLSVQAEVQDKSSSLMLEYAAAATPSIGLAYVQSVYPNYCIGALGQFDLAKNTLTTAYAGTFDDGISSVTVVLDKQLQILYIRKVNPSRVHLSTDVVFNEDGSSQMSLAAEYILKQSKLHMAIDSNLTVKSMLETSVLPGFTLQLCAEQNQPKELYRFGIGIMMG